MRRSVSLGLRGEDPGLVLRAACALARTPGDGNRFVAYELLRVHEGARALVGERALLRLGRGMDRWEAVDCFSVYVAGPAWREGRVGDATIHRWARSADRWWRRAALVSTVPLNSRAHGGRGDPGRTLRVCRILEGDRDPMVVKALSWALRELSKRDPAAVSNHLRARRGALAALVLREVRNKLETGLKNPRSRGRSLVRLRRGL
jgi:3-methyladenine DNA glycosylase AlkD